MSESHDDHHHASEVPAEQRLAAIFTHIGGVVFLFVPALIVWLRTRRDPVDSWLAHQAKEALEFSIHLDGRVLRLRDARLGGAATGFLALCYRVRVRFAVLAYRRGQSCFRRTLRLSGEVHGRPVVPIGAVNIRSNAEIAPESTAFAGSRRR